jgi:transcriptional regulator with XRE-family HTH domain
MNTTLVAFMQDASVRKALGKRIKQLRKEKGLTQKELAKQVNCSHAQLNKYESGLNTPPLDRLLLLAEVLGTSVDYLLAGQGNGKPPLHSQRLIQRFQTIEEFGSDDRETIIKVLDAMIAKHNMESTMKAMEG